MKSSVEVLRELEHRDLALVCGKVDAIEQVLVHADRAVDLALTAEQVSQGKMQVNGLWIDLDDLDKRFDRLVGLLVQQEIQAPEIR
jgi:hypothetical protein